jgi:hypothetical protein
LKRGAIAIGYIVMKKICSPKMKPHRYTGMYGPVFWRIHVKAAMTGGIRAMPSAICRVGQHTLLPVMGSSMSSMPPCRGTGRVHAADGPAPRIRAEAWGSRFGRQEHTFKKASTVLSKCGGGGGGAACFKGKQEKPHRFDDIHEEQAQSLLVEAMLLLYDECAV